MLIEEVTGLDQWIHDNVIENDLPSTFNALISILSNNINTANSRNGNQNLSPFAKQKEELVLALKNINTTQLSINQQKCLSFHDIADELGELASQNINELFQSNVHDLVHIRDQLNSKNNSINTAVKKIDETAKLLYSYIEATDSKDYLEDQAYLSIIFKNDVGVETLRDLEERSKDWKRAIHCIGAAIQIPEKEFKVLGARNGSLIIDLLVVASAMPIISYIVNECMKTITLVVLHAKNIHNIASMDSDSPEIHEQLLQIDKDINNKIVEKYKLITKNAAQNISNTVTTKLGLNGDEG